jgi:hypothetical protein
MPALPGAHHSFVSSGEARERPAQRVFPPAAADHQHLHCTDSIAAMPRGLA